MRDRRDTRNVRRDGKRSAHAKQRTIARKRARQAKFQTR